MRDLELTSAIPPAKGVILMPHVRAAGEGLIYLILSFFVARGAIFGTYLPFGAAMVAAVPYKNIWWTFVGVAVGSILPSDTHLGIRYVAAAAAICAIRWTLNDVHKLKQHALYSPIVAFVPMIMTGFAANVSEGIVYEIVVMNFTESLLAGVGAYFIEQATALTSRRRGMFTINQQDLASIAMASCIIMLSLGSLTIGPVSIGRIVAITSILFCAKCLGITGGSVAGIAAGIVFGLASRNLSYLAGAYSFGGLMAGITAGFGSIALAGAFVLSSAVISIQSGNLDIVIPGVYEALVSSVIFYFLPGAFSQNLTGIFYSPADDKNPNRLRASIIMRLDFTSQALVNISNSVQQVSKRLREIKKDDINSVYVESVDVVCKNCGMRVLCWENNKDDMEGCFNLISPILKESGAIDRENLPNVFSGRCYRVDDMVKSINRLYREFIIRSASRRRIYEVKSFVSEQFTEMGGILNDIAREFEQYEIFDAQAAERVRQALLSCGLRPHDVSCRLDKYKRLYVEMNFSVSEQDKLLKLNLSDLLSKVCFRGLDSPCTRVMGNTIRVQLAQRPTYEVDIGISQHVCNNGTLCGDNYTHFNDGMGRVVIILSDGMGTGGRAAVEGAMSCEIMATLIRSGMSFRTALKITNSALLIKAEDESLAALDLLCVDLFTGQIEILKAGAPFTLLRKNNTTERVAIDSLPVGILKDLTFAGKTDKLLKNDRVLIISDGVITDDDSWIEDEMKLWKDEPSEEFARRVVDKARVIREKDYDDDITALAVKLIEAEK